MMCERFIKHRKIALQMKNNVEQSKMLFEFFFKFMSLPTITNMSILNLFGRIPVLLHYNTYDLSSILVR